MKRQNWLAANVLAIISLLVFFPAFLSAQNVGDPDIPAQEECWDDYLFFEDGAGITITGTLRTSQQMAVISREDIERRGAVDIANILQETLGLNIVRYGPHGNQTGISLRGFDSRRVAFLVNGIPANSPVDGMFDIFQIDPGSIERIEVIHGGSDSRFNISGALGGVINIVTIARQNPGLRLGGSVSNISSMPGRYRGRDGQTHGPRWRDLLDTQNYAFSLAYGGGERNGAFSATANVFFNNAGNHFLFTDNMGHIRRSNNNEVWDTGAAASLLWELPNSIRIISSSHFFYGDRNFPAAQSSSFFGSQQDISGRQSFMVEVPRVFHDSLATEASFSWNIARRDFTSPADEVSRHNHQGVSLINRWNWHPLSGFTLRSGLDYRYTQLNSTDMGRRGRHDGGIFLTVEIRPANQFLIAPSVKAVVASGSTTQITAVPKLGLLWNVSETLTLKNNYFRSFKFPDFEELYWTGGENFFGNPDLLPQDGIGFDLGMTWNPNRHLRLENVFFAQWIKNSIHWFETAGIWRPENVGEAAFFGLSSSIRFEIPVSLGPVEKIIPSLSYQYLLSYLLSFGHTFSSNTRIPYTPQHTVGISLDIPWRTGSLIVSGHFESMRFHDRSNLISLEPYFLLNVAYNQKIGRNLTVFGSLRNILNQSYESFHNYRMPGITLMLGLRVNIEVKNE